jgi:hypothetical protein
MILTCINKIMNFSDKSSFYFSKFSFVMIGYYLIKYCHLYLILNERFMVYLNKEILPTVICYKLSKLHEYI